MISVIVPVYNGERFIGRCLISLLHQTLSKEKYEATPIPPVQVRFNECIGCNACFKACRQLTWDAIRMLPTDEFEAIYNITID